MRSRVLLIFLALALVVLSCGRPDGSLTEITRPDRQPQLLLVDTVISGEILRNPLSKPHGLAADLKGNIYVVDAGNNRLVRFGTDLTPLRDYGGFGKEAGLLDRPSYLAFDNGLNLMVSDEGNRRVSRYNSQLNFVDELSFYDSEDPLKFGYPSGIAFTDYGEVWVADRDNNRVAIFSNVGKFDRFLGDVSYAGERLNTPEKIIRLESGEFVICDAGNQRLIIYDRYGNYSYKIDLSDFEFPKAVASHKGFLWVLDGVTGVVACLDLRGELLYQVGPTITGNEIAMKNPSDLIMLPPNRLLISDSGNNRILVCRIVYEEK
ncbi:MAG: NHL repeat-containing protein [Candidatus Zixiibacteriota bacterium]|nr:MAG: NHL repeat-containing protein [candidate division Zixibacteria bacterium]